MKYRQFMNITAPSRSRSSSICKDGGDFILRDPSYLIKSCFWRDLQTSCPTRQNRRLSACRSVHTSSRTVPACMPVALYR